MGLPECKAVYKSINEEKRIAAVKFLMAHPSIASNYEHIKKAIELDKKSWFADYHFHWGMAIRNILRDNGFGEKEIGAKNLDDVYVDLVEDAIESITLEKAKVI